MKRYQKSEIQSSLYHLLLLAFTFSSTSAGFHFLIYFCWLSLSDLLLLAFTLLSTSAGFHFPIYFCWLSLFHLVLLAFTFSSTSVGFHFLIYFCWLSLCHLLLSFKRLGFLYMKKWYAFMLLVNAFMQDLSLSLPSRKIYTDLKRTIPICISMEHVRWICLVIVFGLLIIFWQVVTNLSVGWKIRHKQGRSAINKVEPYLPISGVYSEPCQTFKKKRFAKIVSSFQP